MKDANIQTAYNGMQSSMRNMFLVSSIGLVLVGFSHKFKKSIYPITFAICIFAVAMTIGVMSMMDFEAIRKNEDNPESAWGRWKYVTGAYVAIILAIIAWAVKSRL